MKRSFLRIGVMAAILLVFVALVEPSILGVIITLLITLLTGWWSSLGRLLGNWHPAFHAVLLFTLTVVAILAGTNAFLRWLYACLRNGVGTKYPVWRWKWTLCGYAMLFCAFMAICSIVLTTHQLYWMSKSSDPLFADPYRKSSAALIAAETLKEYAEDVQWDSTKTRAAFWQQQDVTRPGEPVSEAIQPVWIEKDGVTLRAVVLVPRHPLFSARHGLMVIQPGTNLVERNLSELPQVLASFGIGNTGGISNRPTALLP
jgi:hypothetical protein